MKSLLLLVISFVLISCNSGPSVKTKFGYGLKPELTYMEGVKKTVSVGDVMTSSTPLIVNKVIIIKDVIKASTTHRGKGRYLSAQPGAYRLVREDNEGKFYEAVEKTFTLNDEPAVGGVYLPSSSNNKAALYWSGATSQAYGEQLSRMYMADLNIYPKVETKIVNQLPPNIPDMVVSTLTYTGIALGQVKFVYREYINNLARDAFTQEIALDYISGKTYSYKSARFVLHSADTSQVTYTLISPL